MYVYEIGLSNFHGRLDSRPLKKYEFVNLIHIALLDSGRTSSCVGLVKEHINKSNITFLPKILRQWVMSLHYL